MSQIGVLGEPEHHYGSFAFHEFTCGRAGTPGLHRSGEGLLEGGTVSRPSRYNFGR